MGLLKDRHGTYYARQKVPDNLREAVARILNNGKASQSWLKRSLGTKKLSEANVRAKPVLMEFDRIFAEARGLVAARLIRQSLSSAEIKRMAEFVYQRMLVADDAFIQDAPAIAAENRQLANELPDKPDEWPEALPRYGLSEGQLLDFAESIPDVLKEAKAALARGDILLRI